MNSDETCHPLRSKVGHGFRWPVASDFVATDQARCASQAERVATSHHLAFGLAFVVAPELAGRVNLPHAGPPSMPQIGVLAKAFNVTEATLYAWRREALKAGAVVGDAGAVPEQWSGAA